MLGFPPSDKPPPEEEVAAVFKKLALKWHPDRNPDNEEEATQRFAEISAARDLLLDPPPAALIDEPASGAGGERGMRDHYAPSAASANLREFVGDCTDEIADGRLRGKEAEELFHSFGLWAVWQCTKCELVCCRIRKDNPPWGPSSFLRMGETTVENRCLK